MACKPIESESFFSLLSDATLAESIASMGIVTPTEVQAAAIPQLVAGHDAIIQAETGSGKTLAFMLPFLQMLRNGLSGKNTLALIVTPTRELAGQVAYVIETVAPDVTPACIIGGNTVRSQRTALKRDRRIIVGTPGRILDLLDRREISLKDCRYFVLDEADEMVSLGFLPDVRTIVSKLPPKRQGTMVSATISSRVETLAGDFLRDPVTISTHPANVTAREIRHLYCNVEGGVAGKARSLTRVLDSELPRSAIIFCNTKSDTELVGVFLRRRGFKARYLNSDLPQKERDAVMSKLRSGDLNLLVATDIAARGIDINDLDLVVNYSVHEQPEMYVHRSGRTGRAGRTGQSITLVGPEDFMAFRNLRKALDIDFEEMKVLEPEEELAS